MGGQERQATQQCSRKICQVTLRDICTAWYPLTYLVPILSSLVCITGTSREEVTGAVTVEVPGRGHGVSEFDFAYQVSDAKPFPASSGFLPLWMSQPFWFCLHRATCPEAALFD